MLKRLLDLISPHPCCGCDFIGELLCASCKYDIINEHSETCILCGAPTLNGICDHHKTHYRNAWHAGQRKGSLEVLINRFKFERVRDAVHPLVDILDVTIPVLPHTIVVVPIPTSSQHIRERGYDHTYLLAKGFAKRRHLQLRKLLYRNHSASQRGASKEERFTQAKTAFSVNGSLDAQAAYLLLDDVVTTGATLQAAARVLYKAGARKIYVAALTRQPLD